MCAHVRRGAHTCARVKGTPYALGLNVCVIKENERVVLKFKWVQVKIMGSQNDQI